MGQCCQLTGKKWGQRWWKEPLLMVWKWRNGSIKKVRVWMSRILCVFVDLFVCYFACALNLSIFLFFSNLFNPHVSFHGFWTVFSIFAWLGNYWGNWYFCLMLESLLLSILGCMILWEYKHYGLLLLVLWFSKISWSDLVWEPNELETG